MAFTVQILAPGFALLCLEFLLLPLDPTQLGNGEDTDSIQIHPRRSGNPHPAARGVDAQVDVFDLLEHDLRGDIAEHNLRHHQYSFCALMMGKRRSTSFTSRRMSYSAFLITRSRGSTPRQSSGRTCLMVAVNLQRQVQHWITAGAIDGTRASDTLPPFRQGVGQFQVVIERA